jgi:hypothetical protein
VAWIGSGLSAGAYKSWAEIVCELCTACAVSPLDTKEEPPASVLVDKAEECKKKEPAIYDGVLEREYGRPVSGDRLAYGLLKKLPFAAYVTTNYDPLLAFGMRAGTVYAWPWLPAKYLAIRGSVFYLHGMARDGTKPKVRDLVLARSDFDRAYGTRMLPSFLVQLLTDNDVLFLGCTLREPELQAILYEMKKVYAQLRESVPTWREPELYALRNQIYESTDTMPFIRARSETGERLETELLNNLGVAVIRYPTVDEHRQDEIEQILEYLCEQYGAEIPVVPSVNVMVGEVTPNGPKSVL